MKKPKNCMYAQSVCPVMKQAKAQQNELEEIRSKLRAIEVCNMQDINNLKKALREIVS